MYRCTYLCHHPPPNSIWKAEASGPACSTLFRGSQGYKPDLITKLKWGLGLAALQSSSGYADSEEHLLEAEDSVTSALQGCLQLAIGPSLRLARQPRYNNSGYWQGLWS